MVRDSLNNLTTIPKCVEIHFFSFKRLVAGWGKQIIFFLQFERYNIKINACRRVFKHCQLDRVLMAFTFLSILLQAFVFRKNSQWFFYLHFVFLSIWLFMRSKESFEKSERNACWWLFHIIPNLFILIQYQVLNTSIETIS